VILRHDRRDADCLVDEAQWRSIVTFFDGVDDRWLRLRFDPPPDCTEREGVGGEGDSGGPALIRARGTVTVAGVSSWQDHEGPIGTYGCVEHYARVSTQVPWIRAVTSAGTTRR
jgi:hypothetical protein